MRAIVPKRTRLGWRPVKENVRIPAWIHVGLGALKILMPEMADLFCQIG